MGTRQAMPVGRASSHTKTTNARLKMTSSPAARWHATLTSTWSSALTLKPNGTEPLQSSSAHQSPRSLKPQSGTTEALGAQQRVATATRPLSQMTLLWTITSPTSTREAAAATTTQLRPEDGTSVGVQDVETPRHRFSRSPSHRRGRVLLVGTWSHPDNWHLQLWQAQLLPRRSRCLRKPYRTLPYS